MLYSERNGMCWSVLCVFLCVCKGGREKETERQRGRETYRQRDREAVIITKDWTQHSTTAGP